MLYIYYALCTHTFMQSSSTSVTTLISRPKYLGHKQAIAATGIVEIQSNRPNQELHVKVTCLLIHHFTVYYRAQ